MTESVFCLLRNHFETCQYKNICLCKFPRSFYNTNKHKYHNGQLTLLVFTCLSEYVCVRVIRIYYIKIMLTLRIVFVHVFEHLLCKLVWSRSLFTSFVNLGFETNSCIPSFPTEINISLLNQELFLQVLLFSQSRVCFELYSLCFLLFLFMSCLDKSM